MHNKQYHAIIQIDGINRTALQEIVIKTSMLKTNTNTDKHPRLLSKDRQ